MPTTRRVELELEALQAKKKAIESDIEWKSYQHRSGMPCEPGLEDSSIAMLALHQLRSERDNVGAEIAEKKLQLFDLQGS